MTEQQKVFTSLSGAVIVHLVLLIGIFVLLSFRPADRPIEDGAEADTGKPKEVSILMSDLMKQIELEKAQEKKGRDFVNTEGLDDSEEVPENARFESDRNTKAASRLRPDEILPEEDGATLAGTKDSRTLTLRERNFQDGPEDREPERSGSLLAKAAAVQLPKSNAPSANLLEQAASMRHTYLNPKAGPNAVKIPPTKLEREREQKARELAEKRASEEALPEIPAPEAFSPTSRQNERNGNVETEGDEAVDAMATAMGRYKQEVRKAIEVRWHRYRDEQKDSVIWGMLKLKFRVTPDGDVEQMEITKNESNKTLYEISLRAIRDTELPPMPPEVAEEVGDKGIEIRYDILTY